MSCTLSKLLLLITNIWIFFSTIILASIFASLPRTTRGQPIVLGADPKGKTFLYTNGNSVFIRNIEVRFDFLFYLYFILKI
jgi:hypothetical protein